MRAVPSTSPFGALPLRIASAARYMDYCTNQRLRTAKMTLADPGVAEWVAFLQRNRGRMPAFPLALGLLEDRCLADYVTLDILDHTGAAAFAYACEASGARMLGVGLVAAAGGEHECAEQRDGQGPGADPLGQGRVYAGEMFHRCAFLQRGDRSRTAGGIASAGRVRRARPMLGSGLGGVLYATGNRG
mgnify:CR=1 FL=1